MVKKSIEINLLDVFNEFRETKNIDRKTLIGLLGDAFKLVLSRYYGPEAKFDVIINPDKGDFEIWHRRDVVEDGSVKDPNTQISLTDARMMHGSDYEVGEEVSNRINFDTFGRRTVLNLRQAFASRVLELQKSAFYEEYKQKEGEIVLAEVSQIWKREIILLDGKGNDLILPKSEQIPTDFYRKGDMLKVVVERVHNENLNPKVIVSRTSGKFLQRLMEMEVPEIHDGIISIKKVARIPGERAKVAVDSLDDRIDPVGSCVGVKGVRIHGIVKELKGENIDVIAFTNNSTLFIQRALAPAKISYLKVDEEQKKAEVFLQPEEVSLAIGKAGMNIKLASMITGYHIDVYRDIESAKEEDIYLDEFNDEIDQWVIDVLKGIGCDTAKSVLKLSREELIQRTDLEETTIDNVISVLKSEFEES
ncbi:MAG TPA: transcription termination/antitermination protein NusA [Porphyromonadaceae bacterium]|nr:transcription termination/antitermination protein NusA [Porphyromonadaceae bacterium]